MTQHTQPVGAGQHQHQQHQQTSTPQQQQHQTTTTPNTNNNTNNNNNSSTTPTTTNNNQTQTVAVQQQHQQNNNNNNNNNNNYQSQQQQNATGGQIFNPQMSSANGYVPTLGMPAAAAAAAHHHHPQQHHHHQPYQTMMPAAIPSTVYVHNVTANVNLHGWPHTAPHGPWVHPGGGPHYIHGDLPPEQGAPVIQPMGAMPVTLQAPNALGGPVMNPNPNAISGGTRGSRRGRGRGGTSGSRRGDYNMQRHPQPEGSPAPQQGAQNNPQDMQQQGQQTTDGQQMVTALPPSYVPHPQYAAHAPQYPYAYPTFFAPQQHMIHPGQSAAAQQATGTPLYFSTMPVYNGHQMYNYGYYLPPVMNQSEYQYGEEVGVAGPLGDERQPAGEGGAMMWHQQPMYTDEYGMSPADMHAVSTDDMNHNASSMGSANETPNLLSPNYTPMYEQMTQQMGVMHIYDDPQMGQIQVMHPQPGVPQLEEELSECGSQPSAAPIQMVPAATAAVPPLPMIIEPHYIPVTGGAIMPIDETLTPIATTPQHQQQIQQPALQQQQQQQPSITGDNTIVDSNVQTYENVSNIQAGESVTSLNEEIVQQPAADNIAIEYQQLPQQQQIQTQNVVVEAIQTDNFNNTNKTLMTDVQELPVEKIVHTTVANKSTEVAVETVVATNVVAPQQQQQIITPQPVYQQQQQQTVQEKQHKHQYVAKQNVPQQQQQYQHQQLQTQPVTAQQQQQPTAQPQQQQTHYQASTQQQQHQHHHTQQQQQQHHQQQQTYENRKSSQMYNQQHQSRSRKYDYHHGHGSNSSNSDASSHHQQQQTQQQQTTKTMSWTNSSQHKKSTNTVAVTATPTSSHSSGSYNKQSNASNTSSSHTHSTRTYTNQQHHNYQQQQQQNYHYQQPQTRNYGAMKMPSSPISSAPSTMERKTSQSSDAGKGQGPQSTSTASTTAAPHQFQQQQSQQTTTNNDAVQQTTPTAPTVSASSAAATSISNKQHTQHYPPGFATKKHSFSNQGHSGPSTTPNTTAAAVTSSSSSNAVETSSTPAINLAPPVSANTPAAPSTPSWASLFASSSNTSNSASSNTAASATINTSSNSSSSNTNYSKKPIAKVAPYEGITPVTPPPPVVTPGTLSYSAASAQNLPTPSSASTASTTAKKLEQQQQQSQRNSLANLDEFSLKFAQFLTTYKSDWATVSLRPRGLTNRSNYCYINSILQALLGCSPLYNLIRSIPKQAANLCEVKTPTVNAMMTFMSNFSNLPSGLRLRNSKGGKGNKDDLGGDLQCDPAFEPTEIYKLWNDSREEHVEGRQEDAEEFLSYILNKLNDEMLEVIKLISKPNTEQNGQNEPAEEDGDVWQMICNNRNKGSVTRQTDFGCTPLSDIFRGELRSRLQREGEHSTDVIQPFFTLQLNIEKAASVKEALEILVGRDQLEGVTGSKSKQEVVAWQQMNLEKLPPILILHLKWFDYRSDGCTKILKKVEFPVELKIDSKILASKKYSQKQRAYRLFAVVYHDGKEATKGHYITDVYHTGYGSWLRFDDSSVKPVSENHVLLPRTPRVPYLLCYRRCDTIPQQSNNNQNNSSTGNNNTSGNTQSSSGK